MNSIMGTQFMEQILAALRNERMSASLLVLVGVGVWWVYGWADDRYAHADEVGEIKSLIVQHVEKMEIVVASQLVRDKELALQVAQHSEDKTQISHLENEVRQAREYRQCLIERRPNCEHMKLPE